MSGPNGALSAAAITVLEVVLARDAVGVSAIPAASGLSQPTVDVAIGELTRAGLLHVSKSGAGTIRIEIGSMAALKGLIESASGLARPAAMRLLRARRTLDSVVRGSSTFVPGVDKVVDLEELRSRIGTAVGDTRRELLSLHAGQPPSREMMAASTPDDLQLVRRGVDLQVASPSAHASVDYIRDHVRTMSGAGARIRFADVVPHRLIVLDRSLAVVPLDAARPGRGAMFITEPLLVQSLRYLAVRIVRSGRRIDEVACDGADEEPSPMQRRVLVLMSSGLTDEVAARHLSITDRQFRRYVSGILQRLGASSRFQAGVRAVERGWI